MMLHPEACLEESIKKVKLVLCGKYGTAQLPYRKNALGDVVSLL